MLQRSSLSVPAFVLLLASAAPGVTHALPRAGDDPMPLWSALHATQAPAFARGRDTDAAGAVAVTVGELRDQVSPNAIVRAAFARGFERDTGVELWRWTDPRAASALRVAVAPNGQRAFVIARDPAFSIEDGTEWLVALDSTTGAPVFETARVLDPGDARSYSVPDALVCDASGTRLARLDHFGPLSVSALRVEMFDATNGALLWTFERPGLDLADAHASGASASLALSPDGQIVYASYATFDAVSGSAARDAHLVALDANDGSELWTVSFATPGLSDRVSRPLPSPDSTAVFVATHASGGAATNAAVRRLAASDGAEAWSAPLGFAPGLVGLAPNGTRVVVAGADPSAPATNGADLAVAAVDTTAAAVAWSLVLPQAFTDDAPTDIGFAPDSSRVVLSLERGSLAFPYEPWAQIASFDLATGAGPPPTDLLPSTNWSIDAHFLDVVAAPGGSLAVAGHAVVDQSTNSGTGLDRRFGVSHAGAVVFDTTNTDTIDEESDAFGRLWLSSDGSEVIVWASELDAVNRHAALRIERRRTDDGALLAAHSFGSLAVGARAYLPAVSPDGAFVAFTDLVGVQLVVRVFDLATGVEVFTSPAPMSVASIHLAWSADSTRVGWATESPTVLMGAADVTTGQQLWQEIAGSATTVYSFTALRGIAFDPVDGSLVALFNATSGLVVLTHEYILTRRDGATGQLDWELIYSSEGSIVRDHVFQSLSAATNTVYYGAAPAGVATAPDGSAVYTADLYSHPLRTITRVAASDADDGSLLWTRGSFFGPGKDARLIGLVPSRDGRFLHLLSEGRGDAAQSPKRAYVSTHDATTGLEYWQGFLPDEVVAVRRLVSLGEGGRIAVVSTLADGAGAPDGTLVVVLDAPTGAELARLETRAADGEAIDGAIDDLGRLFTVGARPGGLLGTDGFLERHDLALLEFGPHERSIATGGRSAATLDLDPALAGLGYLLVGSVSGTAPGIPLGGGLALPLVQDAYTDFTLLGANSSFFPNSLGLLDAAGDGEAAVVVPPGVAPGLVGTVFHYAAIVFDPLGGAIVAASDAVDLTLVP